MAAVVLVVLLMEVMAAVVRKRILIFDVKRSCFHEDLGGMTDGPMDRAMDGKLRRPYGGSCGGSSSGDVRGMVVTAVAAVVVAAEMVVAAAVVVVRKKGLKVSKLKKLF